MYILKAVPEDFIVTEVPSFTLDDDGEYSIYKLTKREYNTGTVIQKLASFLKCKLRDIGFAGNKDRNAVTTQYLSLRYGNPGQIKAFLSKDINMEFVGKSTRPIIMGGLIGNKFEITIRDCKKEPKLRENFVNYFGEQRFSTDNVEVGRALLKKDFKKACELLIKSEQKIVIEHIKKIEADYVGALQRLPPTLLLIFIHAFQSYMWNKCASKIVQGPESIDISGQKLTISEDYISGDLSLIGFESELDESKYEEILENVLVEEKVSQRDFIFSQIGRLSAGGGFRSIFAKVTEQSFEKLDDETYKVIFTLPRGCYATVYVAQLFGE
jgi:tRNA pseudouridine13 synthase